jgi:hypothetical protein
MHSPVSSGARMCLPCWASRARCGREGGCWPVSLGDDDRPLTFWRALRTAEFWLLLTGCMVAAAGISAWVVVPLLVAGLSISSLPQHIGFWPRAQRVGVEGAWWRTVALSTLNNLAASCAAFLLGIGWRWLLLMW